MQITLSDIFHDFNDNRKQTLIKRVKTVLQDLQIRMRNELESNNLTNLQTLIKKQQTLKKMEQKLNEITQQIEEKRSRDSYLNNKITEMQTDISKKNELLHHAEDKIKAYADTIKKLQAEIQSKDKQIQILTQQNHQTVKQNQRVQMEKQKHQQIIKKLRNTFIQKVEQTQFILKIKQQKLTESFHQSMTNLQIKNLKEKQLENRVRNQRIQKKNQRIQVNIQTSQINTSRMNQNTSRLQMQVQTKKENKQTQTQMTHQKKISEIIDSSPPSNKEKLQQIRLIYSKTPQKELLLKEIVEKEQTPVKAKQKYYEQQYEQQQEYQIKRQQPKVVKEYAKETTQTYIQTNPVYFKPPTPNKLQKICQVNLGNYNELAHQIKTQIQDVKRKHQKMEQFHRNRFDELVRIYQSRPSHKCDLLQIENLKLTILDLKLQIQKKDNQLANERQLFAKVNQSIVQSQNNILIKRLSAKLGENDFNSKKTSKINQTCSIYLSQSPKRMYTQLSNPNIQQQNYEEAHPRNYTSKLKRRKAQDNVITITRTKNALIYSQNRRSSLKSQTIFSETKKDSNANYQKYSKTKISANE